MEIQQQKLSTLLANNVSTIIFSQNKRKSTVPQFSTNLNQHSYKNQLVWNRFALNTAGRYVTNKIKTGSNGFF
jgi:hypothetical protein